ncbi:hypothetical protein BCR34DRAFT_608443 [Clohesyomyces aquaticus]|uniref:non-specific serine/threonine protein kinase n=1 Tax=Clohesyomyces aquaticus TaxID=1231657 RepID=A0A1Y1Y7A0_9PLEO|nr:hypothetical protein BCR34DRAFT_608443 [Clohesyomyces aquaticus]
MSRCTRQTTLEMMKDLCVRRVALDLDYFPDVDNVWEGFEKIFKGMSTLELFKNHAHYLTHMDLAPQNILIVVKDKQTADLSVTLDWDSAIFALVWMHCELPNWLWLPFEDCLDDEKFNAVPEDPVMPEIKCVSEETAGTVYLRYAYVQEYHRVRNVFFLP